MRTQTSLSVNPPTWEAAKAWCKANGKTFSGLVHDLLEAHLRKAKEDDLKIREQSARYGDPLKDAASEHGDTGRMAKKNGKADVKGRP
jgi:hypothetical protein